MQRVRAKGWELVNVDSTIVAQAPKLAPYMAAINASVAKALGVSVEQVNVKAKTAEKLGPVGLGQSMEARAVALLKQA
jgi:2-C-methyl-D-erythritol 2,4-cyclodiphosphate synthase